jgi:ABC-type taurine transport system substrate-binding protein
VADKALGSTSVGGAAALNLWICHKLSSATTPSSVGGGILGNQVAQNTRQIFGMSADIAALASGTYQVGLCGSSSNAANWNYNEYGYVTALVHN